MFGLPLIALLLLVIWLLAVMFSRGQDGQVSGLTVIGSALISPIIAWFLLSGAMPRLDDARIALEAIEFPMPANGGLIASVGGNSALNDVVIAHAPDRLVRFVATGPETVAIRAAPGESSDWFAKVNKVRGGTALLCTGDASCSAANISIFRSPEDGVPKSTARCAALHIGGWTPPAAVLRALSPVCTFAKKLFSAPQERGEVRSFHVTLSREPWRTTDDPGQVSPVLRIVFDTPETVLLAKSDLREEAARQSGAATFMLSSAGRKPSIAFDSATRGPLPEVTFLVLGGAFRAELQHTVNLKPYLPGTLDTGVEIKDGNGSRFVASGQAAALGNDAHAIVRFTRMNSGWFAVKLMLWIVLAVAVASLTATYWQRRASRIGWAIFTWLEFLLLFRILVSFEAGIVDVSRNAYEALPHALIAYALCPLVLSLFGARRGAQDYLQLAHAGFVFCVAWTVHSAFGTLANFRAWWIIVGAACAVAAALSLVRLLEPSLTRYAGLRGLYARTREAYMLMLNGRWARELQNRYAKLSIRAARAWPGPTEIPLWWWWTVIGLVAIRLLLAYGFGFKEAIPIGTNRFAISIVYVPVVAFLTGYVFSRQMQAGSFLRPLVTAYLVSIVVLGTVVPVLVHDSGAVIYILPAIVIACVVGPQWTDARGIAQFIAQTIKDFAFLAGAIFLATLALFFHLRDASVLYIAAAGIALATLACVQLRIGPRALWPAPAVAALGVLAAALLLSHYPSSFVPIGEIAAKPSHLTQVLSTYNNVNRNDERLLALSDPDLLERVGTRTAEELRADITHMTDYSSSGMLGMGYLNVPVPTELRRYQMNDNVSAIHLLAPFGRVGTFLFLLIQLLCAAIVTAAAIPDRNALSNATPGQFGALICMWTIVFVSTYMVLANALLVPFTGRNVYFLSVASIGDLAEGMTLFILARLFIVREAL